MSIRLARTSDAYAIATVHVHSWQYAYKGILSDEGLKTLSIVEKEAYWKKALRKSHTLLVYEEENTVIGFIYFSPSLDKDKNPTKIGEIIALYLLPNFQGRGFGKELITHVLHLFEERGLREVVLWVLAKNRQGRDFYEKIGFVADGHEKFSHRRGTKLKEIRYTKQINVFS